MPKQLNLEGWAMQADLKSGGCPTQPYPKDRFDLWGRAQAEPIFESRAVYNPLIISNL